MRFLALGSERGLARGFSLGFHLRQIGLLADQRDERRIELGHAFAMFGADRHRLAQPQRIGFKDAGLAALAFGLVGGQHHRHRLFAQPAADFLVQRGNAGAGIHHEERRIRALERYLRLRPHPAGQGFGIFIFPAGGIHRLEGEARDPRLAHAAIARHAGLIVHQRQPFAHQPVEQRGLADIGAANDDHLRELGCGHDRCRWPDRPGLARGRARRGNAQPRSRARSDQSVAQWKAAMARLLSTTGLPGWPVVKGVSSL